MICNLSIGFMGQFRPVHWEGESLEEVRDAALADVHDRYLKEKILEVYTSITTPPLSVTSISIQGYTPTPYGISIRKRPYDHFLDEVVKDFPKHPRLTYPEQKEGEEG